MVKIKAVKECSENSRVNRVIIYLVGARTESTILLELDTMGSEVSSFVS